MSITIRDINSEGLNVVAQWKLDGMAHEVLQRARASSNDKGYAGDVTPHQAWALLSSGIAELVDVRTTKELKATGWVPGARHIEWNSSKAASFVSELGGQTGKEEVVLFICRSGKRSVAAAQAATRLGFQNAFNVLEGIEGNDNSGHGWLNHELPIIHD